MKKTDVTFDELRDLLLELGFGETSEKARPRFEHPAIGTVLLFRIYGREEKVSARDMLVVRLQLIDNGLIEETAFDRFLEKASA